MINKELINDKLVFPYYSYLTIYNCLCKSRDINEKINDAVCFAKVFNYVENEVEYSIAIINDPAILLLNKNNYCILPITDIIVWLDYICSIVDANYSIDYDTISVRKSFSEKREISCYRLYFHMNKGKNIEHKFALTAIRYLYEYPMNVILKDVFRLKCIKEFMNETLLNLHNMISCTLDDSRESFNHGHSFTGDARLISDDELRLKLKRDIYKVNDLFESTKCYSSMSVIPPNVRLNFWESDDEFYEKRLPCYINNYTLLQEERKKITNSTNN